MSIEEFVSTYEGARDAGIRVQLVDGMVIQTSPPTGEHGRCQNYLSTELTSRFGKKPRGPDSPGGWWILTEAGVRYPPATVFCHDLAGWRRERVEKCPKGVPIHDRPDWVCEVLSSNRKTDLVRKKDVLHEWKVPHYWVVDPEDDTLFVFEWADKGYINVASVDTTQKGRFPPFDAIELSVAELLGVEDDE